MISTPIALKVTTLGSFTILRDQELVSGGYWKRRRVCELFKLLLSQHRLHREQVQELLWPSFSIEQAANSFGKTLHLLRRALEPDLATGKSSTYVSLDHDTLFLVPDSMQIDADLFESMAKQIQITRHSLTPKELQVQSTLTEIDATLALYSGDYLPDDLYEDWAQRRRDQLRRTYSSLLEQAAKIAVATSQGPRACAYLHALLEHNSADEQTHRELMLTYARMGRRSDALNQYQQLRDALREELHASPLPETVEFYRAIQAGHVPIDLAESRQMPGYTPNLETRVVPISTHEKQDIIVAKSEVREVESATTAPPDQLDPECILCAKMVGRVDELQRLKQCYMSIHQERRHIFFISGEAGIGKTRLAHELSTWAEEQRALVLRGSCYEMSCSLPYQPLIDMLTMHIRSSNPAQLRSRLGASAVDLAKIVPELRMQLPNLPVPEPLGLEVEQRNLYNAVANYFYAIASEPRLLLVLDDLQWADTATMQLLSYLIVQGANRAKPGSILPFFLLLYRADEVHETHPLRSLLSAQMRTGQAEEMRLKRLKEDEVQSLLIQIAGHPVSTSFSEAIYKHTEGNPFFIGEAIRVLIEEGKLKKVEDRWQTTVTLKKLALSQSVRLLIERRLTHLSPECRMTLAYAAVLGRQFHSTLLCRARNLSDESIAEHIDDAIRTQILVVRDENTYYETSNESMVSQDADLIFTHDKVREVLALWLNPLRRRMAHRQIAQAIEIHYAARLQTHYSKLAYHYQMAEETTKAVDYLQKAATQATSVYAFADAASFMENAVELLLGEEKRSQRAELLRKLSIDAYLYIGRPDKAIEAGIAACALWQELGDYAKEAESRLDVSFSFHWMGREREAIDYIKRALDCLTHVPTETRLLAKVHVQWGLSATASSDISIALEQLQRADNLHSTIGGDDPFISVVSLWARSWCAFAAGTLQEMFDYASQSASLCRAIRMFAWEPMMTYSAAWALMVMGRIDEGVQIAHSALREAQRHNAVGAQGWANLVLAFLAIQQAQWEEAQHFANEAATIAIMMHETDLLARVFWIRSICAGWQSNWQQAVEHGLESLQIAQRDGEVSLAYPYLLMQTAKAYFFISDLEHAQYYLDQSMHFAQEHHYRQLPAIGHRLQGRILHVQGQLEQACEHFELSLAELERLNDVVEAARTREAYSQLFQARNQPGDQERAKALLQQANTVFEQLGVNG